MISPTDVACQAHLVNFIWSLQSVSFLLQV